jgi:hypothetical protein
MSDFTQAAEAKQCSPTSLFKRFNFLLQQRANAMSRQIHLTDIEEGS